MTDGVGLTILVDLFIFNRNKIKAKTIKITIITIISTIFLIFIILLLIKF